MMKPFEYETLIHSLLPAVKDAGKAIMSVYEKMPEAVLKNDGSPVTQADQAAEEILIEALQQYAPDITIISEENISSHSLKPREQYFLVDPLDGTREFLKRDGKGSFTVNIGIIENATPVAGIVYAPALDKMFIGICGVGAFENGKPITVKPFCSDNITALASRSHRDEKTNKWLKENNIKKTISIGSSLKFCLVAAGEADIYPRFSPTMEWDTAAGHAVLLAAGGGVFNPDGTPFTYGKPQYRNGAFIAQSGNTAD